MNKLVADIIDSSRESPVVDDAIWAASGSVLFNLACSDRVDGAFKTGCIYNIVGAESSGKSFIGLSVLAEAAYSSEFTDYKLIYDDAEAAASFDMHHLFGQEASDRIATDSGLPSTYVEDFYYKINTLLEGDSPFIYILDSLDSISTDTDTDKTKEMLDAHMNGKVVSGSYAMSKPKMLSGMLSSICGKLASTKSILIIISQTRDNVNPRSFATQTRSGGRALSFFSSVIMWLSPKDKIYKTVGGDRYQIGVRSTVKISKNKFTGKIRETPLTIKYSFGIDNIQDCIDYLVHHKIFIKKGVKTDASAIGIKPCRNDLLTKHIEEGKLESAVVKLVAKKYNEIEKKLIEGNRIGKYANN